MTAPSPVVGEQQTGMGSWYPLFYRWRRIIFKWWWIVFLTTSAGLSYQAYTVSKAPISYRSEARLIMNNNVEIPGKGMVAESPGDLIGTMSELLQGSEITKSATERVKTLYPDTPTSGASIGVTTVTGGGIIRLTSTGSDPKFVQVYLDAVIQEYMTFRRGLMAGVTETTFSSINAELKNIEAQLHVAEEEVIQFQQENNIVFLQQQGSSAGSYLGGLSNQLASLRTELEFIKSLERNHTVDWVKAMTLSNTGQMMNAQSTEEGESGNRDSKADPKKAAEGQYQQLRQELLVLKNDKEELGRFLKPRHPRMVQIDEKIQRLDRTLALFQNQTKEQITNRRSMIELQIQNLERESVKWEKDAHDLNRKLADYDRLKSKVDRLKTQHARLIETIQNIDISQAIGQEPFSVMESAKPAVSMAIFNRNKILMGGLAGLVLGFVILFAIDRFDDRIRTITEVSNMYAYPILGQVPHEKSLAKEQAAESLLSPQDQRHIYSESYRNIRSSLLYMDVEGERAKTILVTSANPNEGKSTISANIAVTFALLNSKTLIIDADLRHGTTHKFFGFDSNPGLADVLGLKCRAQDVIRPSKIPNLFVMPRGKAMDHPGELFLGQTMDNLIKELYQFFDYIIIDSAPVMVADDTPSLAPKIDGCVFIVRANFTSSRVARNAISILQARQVNILGLVLNDLDTSQPEYYYYKYKDYYYYRRPKQGSS